MQRTPAARCGGGVNNSAVGGGSSRETERADPLFLPSNFSPNSRRRQQLNPYKLKCEKDLLNCRLGPPDFYPQTPNCPEETLNKEVLQAGYKETVDGLEDIRGISATHVGHLRKHVILRCKESISRRLRAINESRVVKRKAGQMHGLPVSGSRLTKLGVFLEQRARGEDFQRKLIEMKFSMSRRIRRQNIGVGSQEQATACQSQALSSSSQVALSISPASIDTMGLPASQARLSDAEASQPPFLTQTLETESASFVASGGNKRRGRGPSRAIGVRILPLGQTVPVDLVAG